MECNPQGLQERAATARKRHHGAYRLRRVMHNGALHKVFFTDSKGSALPGVRGGAAKAA